MKTILLFFAILFNTLVFGQEYRPMLDSDNRWIISFLEEGANGESYYHKYRFDTENSINFNDKEYINVKVKYKSSYNSTWSEWNNSKIYISENIEEKKVFVYYDNYQTNNDGLINGEFLLYDFNLNIGDIIPIDGFVNGYSVEDPIYISSIEYQNVFGYENIKTYMTSRDGYTFVVYEGIGSFDGLFRLSDFSIASRIDYFYQSPTDYIPLIREDYGWEFSFNIWDFEQGQMHYTDFQAKPSDEEIIYNEKTYKAIEWRTRERIEDVPQTDWSAWETKFYLSENIANREVHIYYPDNTVFNHPSGEYLLYDFNLNEGDKVNLDGFNDYDESNNARIQSITYENVFGQENLRTYNLTANNNEFEFQIYEGIGSSYGLINLSFMYDAGWTLNHYGILSVDEFDKIETTVYPNPFTNQIQINSEKPIQNLELFDVNGKLILSKKSISELNSNLNQLQKGMYILQITYPNQQKETIKLIKK